MKKLFTIMAVMALTSASAIAGGHFGAGAISGTTATSAAIGGGFSVGNGSALSVQATSAGAVNTTSVGANSQLGLHNTNNVASVFSAGGSYSASAGVTTMSGSAIAAGQTGGIAAQGGLGAAYANGFAFDVAFDADSVAGGIGFATTDAFAAQGSISGSNVTNTGTAIDVAFGVAGTESTAGVHVDATPHNVTINQYANVDTIAGGGSASAVTGTGIAEGAGGGIAFGDADTIGFQAVIALP